jgi:hypothetical protein
VTSTKNNFVACVSGEEERFVFKTFGFIQMYFGRLRQSKFTDIGT